MPKIIKDAFVEGRETDTDWKKSTARKNQIKLDVALENVSIMSKRDIHSNIPLHQICPTTGRVVNTFPSRIAAARYIVECVLRNPTKNPVSITGNMAMCMNAGWKAYGFYWKLATPESIDKHVKSSAANATRVFMTYRAKGGVFESIKAAAATFGFPEKAIRKHMAPNSPQLAHNYLVQEYNSQPRTLSFDNVQEAARYANVSPVRMYRWAIKQMVVNNTKYSIKTCKSVPKFVVYDSGKVVGKYKTMAEVAKVVGIHRTKIPAKMAVNERIGPKGYLVKKISV